MGDGRSGRGVGKINLNNINRLVHDGLSNRGSSGPFPSFAALLSFIECRHYKGGREEGGGSAREENNKHRETRNGKCLAKTRFY